MEFIIDNKVRDLGIKILGVKLEGINNTTSREFETWRKEKISELLEKYKDYDIKSDNIIEGFYKIHEKVGVPRRKNLPASENLIKLLTKRGELISINPAVDIYNIISIDSKLPLGAHDIDKVSGNVSLRLLDGNENFIPLGSDEAKEVKLGEYGFVDDNNDVLCWLDIRQVDKTKVTDNTKNVIYFVIGNEENTYEELECVANNIIDVTTTYCGGKSTILK